MNPDKRIIIDDLTARANASPFLIVVDYTSITVPEFTNLRSALAACGAQCHVAKNNFMRTALTDAGLPDIGEHLVGQTAFVTGASDVAAAAKAINTFAKASKKAEYKVAILDGAILSADDIRAIGELPPRDQLLAAMDFMKPATVREGVKWLPDKQLDVFFVTLNKADKDYSPTTMYNDYSISESLFHWQSQSTTAENSPTGQRYIHHRERGSKVLLFVREFKSDRMTGGAEAYTYLGTASYVKHEGSRPMNITWQLDRPIPAKFLKKTNKLVVG